MPLTQKFKYTVFGAVVKVTSLYMGTRYPVLHCEHTDTKYGESIRLTIREEAEDNVTLVFLPRRYSRTFTDDNITVINNGQIQYYISYKGKSASSQHPMLQMDV